MIPIIPLLTIKAALSTAYLFVKTHYRLFLVGLGILVVLAFVAWSYGCYTGYQTQKTQDDINEIKRDTTNSKIGVEIIPVEKAKEDAKNAEKEAEKAVSNVNAARDADLRRSDGNAQSVRERYCRNYKDDPICK